jgi:hypothetical protein
MSRDTTTLISNTAMRRGQNRPDSTGRTAFQPSNHTLMRGLRPIPPIQKAFRKIIFVVISPAMHVAPTTLRRQLAARSAPVFFRSDLQQRRRDSRSTLFLGEPVEQARAVLSAHPKSPSRLKVCRFADRYILCGRYGAALSCSGGVGITSKAAIVSAYVRALSLSRV